MCDTVSSFYPSLDGFVGRTGINESWANKRTGAGTGSSTTGKALLIQLQASSNCCEWIHLRRSILLFDTESLPGCTISGATLGTVDSSEGDGFSNEFSDSLSLVCTTTACDCALENADYGRIGTTKQAADLPMACLTRDDETYNNFTLTCAALCNISKTGITKFAIRYTSDNDDSEPTWASLDFGRYTPASAEETLSCERKPKLTVTHSGSLETPFTPRILFI